MKPTLGKDIVGGFLLALLILGVAGAVYYDSIRQLTAGASSRLAPAVIGVGGLVALAVAGAALAVISRRFAEQRRADERMRLVVEAAPNALVMVDREGRIMLVNAQAERVFGYSRDELIGQLVERLLPHGYRAAHPQRRAGYLAHPQTRLMGAGRDLFGLRKDGSEVPVEIGLNPLVTREGAFVLASIIDITERKRTEDLLRTRNEELRLATERAEAADRIKSAFLATMSHELRTPLNSIIGFTGILLQELAGPLNPEQNKQLDMVRSSARHLLALINDVLDISKIEAGQLEVVAEPFDVRTSVAKIAGIVAPLAEKKGLALRTQLAGKLGEVASDKRRVEQILLNLLNNAIKFTDRGEVALAVDEVPDFKSPGGTSAQPAVRLRVSDTGIGIKSEDMATLFRPFRQIDSGLSRNHEGTGLGLAICRGLADLMGAEIRAESEWGKGSVFTFTVPVKGAARS